MTPILRNGKATIRTRLFEALDEGKIQLPAAFAAEIDAAATAIAAQFGCAQTTAKRYLQEWKTQQKRKYERKKHVGYDDPWRALAAAIVVAAAEDSDWEWLEGEVGGDLLDSMTEMGADGARAKLRGWDFDKGAPKGEALR